MNELPQSTNEIGVVKSDMARFGYCILNDVLGQAELNTVRDRFIEQVEAEAGIGLTHHMPDKKQLVLFLLNKGQIFRDILVKESVYDVLSLVLGEEYLLSSFNGHIAHPGGYTRLHTDQFWMPPPTASDKKTLLRPGSITREGHRGHHRLGEK